MIYVITGVLGSGKTTVGKMAAGKIGAEFYDADDYLTHSSRKKLSKGIPLTEKEWKDLMFAMRAIVDRELARGGSAVIACTALKERYRKLLMHQPEKMKLIYLKGTREFIERKLKKNKNRHNASFEVLKTQFEMFEEPKNAVVFDITRPREYIAGEIAKMDILDKKQP
jgi:carbohydrate kinase (thermoresistant glucokinase family)